MQEQGSYLKSLKVLHLALLAGQCMLLAVMVFVVNRKRMAPVAASMDKTLQVVALLAALAGTFLAMQLFKKKMAVINDNACTLQEKAVQYRTASILQWSITEFAVLFIIICFFLTANYSFAALAAFLIIYFALQMPSRIKLMLQLKLTEQEADRLQ